MISTTASTSLQVEEGIVLHLLDHVHTKPVFALIDKNRPYLRQWLPWVDHMRSAKDFSSYVTYCKVQYRQGTDEGYVIEVNKIIVGRIGLHHICHSNKTAAIGYWLEEKAAGRGIITKCCQRLLQQGFQALGLNRIELKCGTGNTKSAAIPERLSFTKEGVLRQAEWVNDRFIDLLIYSLLRHEWKGRSAE